MNMKAAVNILAVDREIGQIRWDNEDDDGDDGDGGDGDVDEDDGRA